jgi:hypothetical protein
VSLEVFFPGGVEPQLEGDQLLKDYEKQRLSLGGTSELRPHLMNFIKYKCS